MQVKVLFVFPHNITSECIDIAQGIGEDPCHVAVFGCGGLLESVRPAVRISKDITIYDNCKTEIIEVEVEDISEAEKLGYSLVGRPYGYKSCISGFINGLTGANVDFNSDSINCSEVGTLYLRACKLNILQGEPESCVTPKILYRELLVIGKREVA